MPLFIRTPPVYLVLESTYPVETNNIVLIFPFSVTAVQFFKNLLASGSVDKTIK